MIHIQNVGRKIGEKTTARKIQFAAEYDENGKAVIGEDGKIAQDEILPGKHKKVTEAQFKHLKAIFGTEILNLDDLEELKDNAGRDHPTTKVRPTGYLSPEEVDAKVKEEVAKALSGQTDSGKTGGEGGDEEDEKKATPTKGELIEKIDGMDKAELITFIEENELAVEHGKIKKIDDLKKAVFTAMTAEKEAA